MSGMTRPLLFSREYVSDSHWRYLAPSGCGPERLATGFFKFPEMGNVSEN
jgi:hypothetical protein